ncbi:MAG: hypothetical protein JRH20_01760 [Deltaproteobacteria bacterium]|nr:hypothetical protein [Deltaproteobacteria bacterium]
MTRKDDLRLANLEALRELISASQGPRQVIAITNGGDGPIVAERLQGVAQEIFRADGSTHVFAHEERTRRGQLLGLLDAQQAVQAQGFKPEGVALGIMLPGKGTRLSPLTQRLHGIKPFLPMLIRRQAASPWLSGASASLFSWALVAHHLESMGFSGVAWKWGDEPQIPALDLGALGLDLSHTDALRFGCEITITEDLARNKEWLLRDAESAELKLQVRRRSRSELLSRFELADTPKAKALVHIGSPALSYVFLEEAQRTFGEMKGWLDVDGYLFEALTHEEDAWQAEAARDPGLRKLLDERPDFYEKVRELKARLEQRRGRALSIKVIDFGAGLYWGDIGQLAKARDGYLQLLDVGPEGSFARQLAAVAESTRDPQGNLVIGECRVPMDGSVRDSLIIESVIEGTAQIEGSVIVDSRLQGVQATRAVAFECTCHDLALDQGAFAFRAVGDAIKVAAEHVLTTLPVDPTDLEQGLEHLIWDSRKDPGTPEAYEEAHAPNRLSFAEKFAQMRQREVTPDAIEAAIDARYRTL